MSNFMQEQLNNLERSVGRIEGKLDGILAHLDKINSAIEGHDRRIDGLEQENARAKGIAAGISFVISVIVGIITFFIKHK